MGLLEKLFGKKKSTKEATSAKETIPAKEASTPSASQGARADYQTLVLSKNRTEPVSKEELLKIFSVYFAPNTDFYSVPGSPKFEAYFEVVNAARDEMFRNQQLFTASTKWTTEQLVDLVNNPVPGITNMMVCGLIFVMGDFAVIKDALHCVDFCEAIPNCIALYLLLTAQKMPQESRRMGIDAGDGCDSTALSKAMETLKVCDPDWKYTIF